MNTPETVLSLHDVGFCYPKHNSLLGRDRDVYWALKRVSFDVREGEVVGVVGRNGAGKSTLLKLLAGITAPDTGSIDCRKDLRRTLLSIQAGFDMYLSGRDNAIIGGMLLGMRRKEILARLDRIRELADLGDFWGEPIRMYSAGMRARLGFATAYYADTDIMLLDEVFAVGDVKFSQSAHQLMQERIHDHKTAVVVSHSEQLVKQLCHRLMWIEDGVVREDGETDEVWALYWKAFRETRNGR